MNNCANCGDAKISGNEFCRECGKAYPRQNFQMQAFWVAVIVNIVVYFLSGDLLYSLIASPLTYMAFIGYRKSECGDNWKNQEVFSIVLAAPLAMWGAVLFSLIK